MHVHEEYAFSSFMQHILRLARENVSENLTEELLIHYQEQQQEDGVRMVRIQISSYVNEGV